MLTLLALGCSSPAGARGTDDAGPGWIDASGDAIGADAPASAQADARAAAVDAGVDAAPTPAVAVQVWLSDATHTLVRQPDVAFAADAPSDSPTLDVDDTQVFQTMDGFGAAMTDTAAWLIVTKMSASQRDALMTRLFDPTSGAGFDFLRVPMGASDFHVGGNTTNNCSDASSGLYSYDDSPPGGTDAALAHFSIAHDLPYIIPALKQAIALNPSMKILATPWSPPPWMKTNGEMTDCGNSGGFITTDYGALATYFVKFVQAYSAQGVPIYAITPQNEPGQQSDYPGMDFSAAEETTFIGQYLGPALAAAKLTPRVLAFDYNWGTSTFPATVLGDPAAGPVVDGTAFHCYGGGSAGQGTTIHGTYPGKDIYETECSVPTPQFENTVDLVIAACRNWSKTVLTWTLAADTSGGPKTGSGCQGCLGTVTIDQATGDATYNPQYFQLSHVSKFVQPGAQRIDSSPLVDENGNAQNVAFENPDGSKVVLVHNTTGASATLRLRWNLTESLSYTLATDAVATFIWTGTAPSVTRPLSFNAGGPCVPPFDLDTICTGGATYSTTATVSTAGVTAPAPAAVYQSERNGTFTCAAHPLTPGASYRVRLHFAEIFFAAAAQREFNVVINGTQVLTAFDIFAEAGADQALVEEFDTAADATGVVTVDFVPVTGFNKPKLSGLEIVPQ
jgi:glucosylceramidase